MGFYFSAFEKRTPPAPLRHRKGIECVWQILSVTALVCGANYIRWRWMESLNYDALWYSVPLLLAETCAYVGTIFFTINLWKLQDYKRQQPPATINQCLEPSAQHGDDRPISVDLFIATYSEDVELVRLSIIDANKVTVPNAISYKIYVLDDGRRAEMRQVAEEEGVNYITRDQNTGFKAGNLRNGMELTDGDFIIICDADTRVFPSILCDTLGYFRDPDVAWVQTPQWFYDIPAGKPLPKKLQQRFGKGGYYLGKAVESCIGPITIGHDPFANDPQMFYDIILRRRNWANAAFCCGAASIHRREAVMQTALRRYHHDIEAEIDKYTDDIEHEEFKTSLRGAMLRQVANETELMPYKFHVSEDIYTSLMLHGDHERRWRSVMHPEVESKMLSPQDLLSWMIQRFKYAAGSVDILFHDRLFKRGNLNLSVPQKLMYGSTFISYMACIWNTIFLIAPMIYLFTGIPPLSVYSTPFYLHFIPFFLLSEVAFMFGTWGISAWDGKASYLGLFSMNLRAIDTVLRGEKIKFHVTPKERQQGNFLGLVKPQLAIVGVTLLALIAGGLQLYWGRIEDPSGFLINIFWCSLNIAAMIPMIRAALWQPEPSEEEMAVPEEISNVN
ncbi:glycosyltransferase [Serratia sp. DD3]|uniref:glycosyltransferase n=1 Tax=Serratia sp. DD3 TaxID=1410619 RepID=UPI0003C502D2|nr:glycosyltransferase [Serratia sp. DD3]KEY57546.1 cellulose synthase 1 [Serratia sp. DD3]